LHKCCNNASGIFFPRVCFPRKCFTIKWSQLPDLGYFAGLAVHSVVAPNEEVTTKNRTAFTRRTCLEFIQNSTELFHYFSKPKLRRLVSEMVSILVSMIRCYALTARFPRLIFLSALRERARKRGSRNETRSPEAKPLARVGAGGKPDAGVWGRQ